MKILRLAEFTTFKQASIHHIQARFAYIEHQPDMHLTDGTMIATVDDQPQTFRTTDGQFVYHESGIFPVHDITSPQLVALFKASADEIELLMTKHNLDFDRISHSRPFATIFCPMCGDQNFTSIEFAEVWCKTCNTRFSIRMTAGDPGFVADAFIDHYNWSKSPYIMPRHSHHGFYQVCKSGEDGRPWHFMGVPPDLPSHTHTTIKLSDGTTWPYTTCVQNPPASQEFRDMIYNAWCKLYSVPDTEELRTGLHKITTMPTNRHCTSLEYLPDPDQLEQGQKFLLYGYHTYVNSNYNFATPVWWIITTPVAREKYHTPEAELVARLCIRCRKPLHYRPTNKLHGHYHCRSEWERTGWTPELLEYPSSEEE